MSSLSSSSSDQSGGDDDKKKKKKKKTTYLKVHFPVAVIVTLLFAHPVVTKAAVKLVACRTVAGRGFLDAEFNISCTSEQYIFWVTTVAIPMFICFTFGVPLVYALAMYRHVRKGTLSTRRDIFGFLFSGFRKEIWWFELWNTLRKSLFTISAVIFAPAGVMMQTWAALVLLLLFVVVFSLAQPYEETYLNHLERGALSINIITLLFGLGLFTNDQAGDDAKSGALAMLITIGIVGCNLFFVFSVGRTLFTHSQYCAVCKSRTKGKLNKSSVVVVPSGGGVQDYAIRMIEDNYREHRTAHVAKTKQRELLADKRVQLRLTERKAKNEARRVPVAVVTGKTKAKDAKQDIMLPGPLKPPPKPPRKPLTKQPPKPKLPPKLPPKQKRKRPKNVGENNEEHPTRKE
jgi:hypothetical protein